VSNSDTLIIALRPRPFRPKRSHRHSGIKDSYCAAAFCNLIFLKLLSATPIRRRIALSERAMAVRMAGVKRAVVQ
jgi:hypothetical protein